MATINKDFKIKNGLIVEGSTATVNNYDILTKSSADTTYIQGLVGGVANSEAVANAIVLRDANANFAANVITADLVGDVTGQVSDISNFDTDDLTEGNNLYFTNQRALDATSSAYDAIGAADTAQTNAQNYADGAASTAQTNAQNYADGLASNYDAAGSADTAQTNAQNYADSVAGSSADTAQTNAQNYADSLASNYDAAGSADTAQTNAQNYADSVADTAQTNAQNYADNAVSALVDSAPELLNTLNELAAAIGDDANFATTLTNLVATKQDILTAGSNIDITGNTISVTGVDLAGSADTAQTNAQNYADSLAGNYDAAGSADTAQTNAQNYADSAIGALSTSDIEEGSNQYFTDGRAKDSAADLLTGATLTNITITGTGSGLTITAENGVADSDTDDLVEGTTNLYFTDARVANAITSATEIAPQAIDITWVRREEATWTDVVTASTVTAHEFATSEGSVKYLVRIFQGGNSQVSEVLVTTDSSNNIAVLEYGTIYTSANPLATITADWDSVNSKYRLRVTTANNSSEILVAATMLAYND